MNVDKDLEERVLRYASALMAQEGHDLDPAAAERVVRARLALVSYLQADGWKPPSKVLARAERDRARLDQPSGPNDS